uniref:Uncharacterized protein n=1 Tax=Candidatus Kentrum sp. FW TaxID=2126338 RepID=A0A450TIZ6_9GAMM|nr:MAG: hypothetical protein BECKFW1821A_GA0114235_100126 [Candidatus Kentron sp. FW]VFJ52435.1 MAG: hypothetical protein BECKFW1821B_GA0114236_101220 [Candidatus Kentron sp. FW]VFJ53883.1 MAG: hypothetical protein BECKFW1821B_GA0114236_101621 [Candidatus Kentron sp. FW]VFJ54381.1 MAG: hypothetical protein BECKFW1821A_GA0114235_104720 [Candidatus Kentron sp. FW]VFJ55179.1 MAG: hypothetical protein BECKFW1821A_GA0114235_105213 [Candidatus Kentron sp. FW]
MNCNLKLFFPESCGLVDESFGTAFALRDVWTAGWTTSMLPTG